MQRASRRRGVSWGTANASRPAVRGVRIYTVPASIASICRNNEPAGGRYAMAAQEAVAMCPATRIRCRPATLGGRRPSACFILYTGASDPPGVWTLRELAACRTIGLPT